MLKKGLILFMVPGIFLMTTCRKTAHENLISSGMIEYSINYLNQDLNAKEAGLLPKSMELVFDQKHVINFIDGFMGLYKLNSMTDFDSRRCSTLLKVFDKHYLYEGKKGELMCCFDSMEDMEIEETNEIRIIAGLTCRRAIVTLPSTDESFDIYYTRDIDLRHPNMNNPYRKIDGVLVQFELQLFHLRMQFTAEKLTRQINRQSRWLLPGSTMEITRDQMTQILSRLME